jgi:LuxR family maltose regulon positive regulatory protein
MVQMAQRIGNVWTLAVAVGQMTFATRLRGRLRVTDDAVAQALRVVHERSEESYGPAGLLESNQAGLVYERNDLAGAHELLVHALALLRGWGNPTALTSALWSMARVQLAQGDLAGAEQTLAEADAIVARTPVPAYTRAALAAERVRIWLAQGRLDEATRWADTIDLGDARSPAREPLGLALARGRLATGRATEAAQVLEGLARDARVAGRFGPLLEVLILNAVALADHSRPAALDRLEEALRLGAPEGYVRTFVNEGEPLRRLLGELIPRWERRRADPTHTPVTYATGLLSAMAAPTVPPEGQPGPVRPVEPLVEPLSARELEVLALVQAGLSNREIAERLVVTVATVKKHLENIHGKLGVHSRTQALARARALGLI